jgi:hypothetical protein
MASVSDELVLLKLVFALHADHEMLFFGSAMIFIRVIALSLGRGSLCLVKFFVASLFSICLVKGLLGSVVPPQSRSSDSVTANWSRCC